ncbi:tripartite tricarboxylate transporter TctB family protein [Paracoccus sp. Z330]|uniref:Tripartite tricarboxylate transporter TctB family protein n=1 Tax=Paracoccus onchidii TaxID=3017813 RepID=A0ABT4ZJY3_9RHOB|nr:tripartite tricarboxylate transporter TctB family protein [Paracoccus onchidii]MDB6179509.1 tripartite tricarboxylate transporter TctB family protein [Paracoccus onchidii]
MTDDGKGLMTRDFVSGLAMVIIGALVLKIAMEIEITEQGGIGPRVFPVAGGGAILMLGVIQTLHAIRTPLAESDLPRWRHMMPVLLLCALAIGYLFAITMLGYLIGTAISAPLALLLFGVRSPLALLAAAVLCPAIYHLVFFVGLGVFPPYGAWFDLLDVFQGY